MILVVQLDTDAPVRFLDQFRDGCSCPGRKIRKGFEIQATLGARSLEFDVITEVRIAENRELLTHALGRHIGPFVQPFQAFSHGFLDLNIFQHARTRRISRFFAIARADCGLRRVLVNQVFGDEPFLFGVQRHDEYSPLRRTVVLEMS